jgi:ABC-2 type transport system ATP-binding protein
VITVERLTKRFGATLAVDDLSFRAQAGRVTGFLGPNGSGKTTTLRAVLGLVRPTAGSATVFGLPYRELDTPLGRVGAVLEASGFHPGRSGRNHVRVVARAAGVAPSRVDEVLELVELGDDARRRVGGYSLGMRQRLSLAVALLGDPEALVLDEPANGLDPHGIRWLRGVLRSLADGGRVVLVSSHVLAEVEQLADEAVIINRGRLVASAPVSELAARTGVAARVQSPERDRLVGALREAGIAASPVGDLGLDVEASPERVGEVAARAGVVLHELVAVAPTLEEAFLELVEGKEGSFAPGGADGVRP